MTLRALLTVLLMLPATLQAQTAEPHMTPDRMINILTALDPDARISPRGIELTISDVPVLVIADVLSNRMRAMVPIRSATGMDTEELMRVLQANFDTALDARYAVAQGRLWAVYIHPLREVERDQLISGIAQTVNIAQTYGTLYHGGAIRYGRGDSIELQRELLEELLKRGQEL